jgi:hypothetical protein
MGESIMNSNHPGDDLVARAIKALLGTAGPDEPPAMVLSQVRQTIADRQTPGFAKPPMPGTHRDGVSWLALAVSLLLMLASGWVAGYHGRLFSQIAGRESAAHGPGYIFYTDGRVEVTKAESQPQAMLDPIIPPRQGVT